MKPGMILTESGRVMTPAEYEKLYREELVRRQAFWLRELGPLK